MQLGCEADYSSPSSAKVKNVSSYTCTPPYVFMVQCLIKHRDSFTLPCLTYVGDTIFSSMSKVMVTFLTSYPFSVLDQSSFISMYLPLERFLAC